MKYRELAARELQQHAPVFGEVAHASFRRQPQSDAS